MNELDLKKKQEEIVQNQVTEIGKIDPHFGNQNRASRTVTEEELDKSVSASLGMFEIGMDLLPSKGRFYPGDMRIYIRPARTSEIKSF